MARARSVAGLHDWLKAFGMNVIGVRRDPSKAVDGVDELHTTDKFVSLLPRADIVYWPAH